MTLFWAGPPDKVNLVLTPPPPSKGGRWRWLCSPPRPSRWEGASALARVARFASGKKFPWPRTVPSVQSVAWQSMSSDGFSQQVGFFFNVTWSNVSGYKLQ